MNNQTQSPVLPQAQQPSQQPNQPQFPYPQVYQGQQPYKQMGQQFPPYPMFNPQYQQMPPQQYQQQPKIQPYQNVVSHQQKSVVAQKVEQKLQLKKKKLNIGSQSFQKNKEEAEQQKKAQEEGNDEWNLDIQKKEPETQQQQQQKQQQEQQEAEIPKQTAGLKLTKKPKNQEEQQDLEKKQKDEEQQKLKEDEQKKKLQEEEKKKAEEAKKIQEQKDKELKEKQQKEKEQQEQKEKEQKEKAIKQQEESKMQSEVTKAASGSAGIVRIHINLLLTLIKEQKKKEPTIKNPEILAIKQRQIQSKKLTGGATRQPTRQQQKQQPKEREQKDNQQKEPQIVIKREINPILQKSNQWMQNIVHKGNSDIKELQFKLNQLTPTNYEKIKKVIYEAIKSEEICKEFVAILIKKAWEDQKYIKQYSDLSAYLSKQALIFEKEAQPSSPSKKKVNYFKQSLIEKIQQAFDKQSQEPSKDKNKEKEKEKEKEEKKIQPNIQIEKSLKKKRILGNIEFIAQLYQADLLPQKLIKYVSLQLVQNFQKHYHKFCQQKRDENLNIEGILQLYNAIGDKLDAKQPPMTPAVQEEKDKLFKKVVDQINHANTLNESEVANYQASPLMTYENQFIVDIDFIFQWISYINEHAKNLSIRISCLIQNLVSRRKNDWKKYMTQQEVPQTLEQFWKEQDEARIKAEAELRLYQNNEKKQMKGRGGQQYQQVMYQQKNTSNQVQPKVFSNEEYYNTSDKKKFDSSNFQGKGYKGKLTFNKNENLSSPKKHQSPELTLDQIQKKLEQKFVALDKGFIETETEKADYSNDTFYNDCVSLLEQSKQNLFIRAYLNKFYDGKVQSVKKRYFIPLRLYKDKKIELQIFYQEFKQVLKKVWEIIDDFPVLYESLCEVYFDLYSEENKISKIFDENFHFNQNFQSEDDKEGCQYALQTFFETYYRVSKKRNLAETIAADLRILFKEQTQIGVEDIDEWFTMFN